MEKKLEIFIISHKEITNYPSNNQYKLILLNDIKTDCTLDKIVCDEKKNKILKMKHAYSEGAGIHYIWKNVELPNYVGINHYRRFFDFWNNIPDIEKIFNEYGAILPLFDIGWKTLMENYQNCHNIKDIELVLDIIKNKFSKYYEISLKQYYSNVFYPCNIFIVKKETFIEWCEFVFGVLDEYNNIMGFKNDLDILNYVANNLSAYCEQHEGLNSTTTYQTRIHAFLMERLSTFFFCYKFETGELKQPLLKEMYLTEINHKSEARYFPQYKNTKNIKQ
jgi:hypothetical protein